ncbi:IS4 family transposase [Propylenella binzhouense]|uniref:IS4 family transposase n=2 Tax=Propylenella binzhouense TaxID=2555902 RepID=A0A964T8P6_9HYPH|nr:IS4 family transposase [Propylenella binzhouense]
MRHHNSVFHDVLKQVPWGVFERLVEEHAADKHVRRLSTKSQFIALLYGQLAGAVSLRETVEGLASHAARLYHVGARPAARSTLADANARRPSAVFGGLFAAILAQAQRGLRRKLGEAVYLIDSTGLRLRGAGSDWARFSAHACGAKLHVVYDADAERPIYAALTAARVNDITAAKAMPIEAGATYVFDLGYYDYGWWAGMAARGCRLVTRFKATTPLTVTAERALPEDATAILSDRIGLLPRRQAASRTNPFSDPVREVRVRIDTGRVLRILTNDLDAPAQEIAALYRRRWAIELFFRWVKQTLRIRHFLGLSENAVRIQVAVALIAFLILRLAQAAQTAVESPLAFARLVRVNLMHKRRIDRLTGHDPPAEPSNQMVLQWA